ncbi:MAG: hypothetical protein J6Q21_01325 [Alistipes sp.]|nr:hypothetical protein [Alistipes sp.]
MSRTSVLVMPWRSRVEELKNLKVSETMDTRTTREMFHFVQHDNIEYQTIT